MAKEKLNLSLVIPIGTILITVGTTWGVMQSKVGEIDKVKDVVEYNDKKLAVVEVNLNNIDQNMKEQKDHIKELKDDIKAILREVKK